MWNPSIVRGVVDRRAVRQLHPSWCLLGALKTSHILSSIMIACDRRFEAIPLIIIHISIFLFLLSFIRVRSRKFLKTNGTSYVSHFLDLSGISNQGTCSYSIAAYYMYIETERKRENPSVMLRPKISFFHHLIEILHIRSWKHWIHRI